MAKIICFGEILWDVFSTHKKIGGAPLNVASRMQSFGHKVSKISAVGDDELGRDLMSYLKENNINSDLVQLKNNQKTSQVLVTLDKNKTASYEIEFPCAWDFITLEERAKKMVSGADAFIFGSLVSRNETSKKTLIELLQHATYKVFDLNLRPPHYSLKLLKELMNLSDFLKFNDDELYEISKKMGSKYNSLEQNLHFIAQKTNTSEICVTLGAHGAVLFQSGKIYHNFGYQIKVKDTVGAGDSFLAALISNLINKETPQKSIDIACAVGALVAGREGANPKLLKQEMNSFINPS